ncbi:ubiquitin carboxyl-terminal hydrolase 20 isoform X2 [Bacillus rossius redtenbacheri]|uniref:ubiquitin carboxyl-terminal hydrolase 20 isoform X2 n=1 Tax=Bacillus rossius redtenbacheri TaxID=93214 RepID=UPI002FDCC9C0
MTSRATKCPHIASFVEFQPGDLDRVRENGKCADCDSRGPNLWLCLHRGCYRIGCGEAQNDHSTIHNKAMRSHCIHLNMSTHRAWCYLCEMEVFLDQGESAPCVRPAASRYSPLPPAMGDSAESSGSEDSRDDSGKPRGLTGLQNIGNTCYMNSALQALSNTTPLTQFFLDCGSAVVSRLGDRKPGLSRSYLRLVQDMWHRKRPGYVVPSGILYGIRNVHPMFRGYQQHDTQEFLRCFMDQLHEELKEPAADCPRDKGEALRSHDCKHVVEELSEEEDVGSGGVSSQSQSEGEYETCDSGVSERSSLSDGEKSRLGSKRKLSRSPSPPQQERVRSKKSHGCPSSQSSPVRSSRKKQLPKYRSIISDVFDGKLLSSVQCLTCDRVSTRVETFQDLSLPIPSRDHVNMLHQGSLTPSKGGLSACSDVYPGDQGWVSWLWEWIRSWFWGPTISLQDCLAAFFSADELKGDNMYSCEKCSKLRNGVKYSKVLELPEVLCIHLKRFRHELMFSSKINNYVSFPLEGLDMRQHLHKDCVSQVTSYDLVSVICHHGTAGGGHYTCYALNCVSEQWFEFDDQYVTQVSPETVQNCEAYVLFYKKASERTAKLRQRAVELMELSQREPGLMQFYVSKQWVNRFNTFAEPGPIDNSDFLCVHGGVHPSKEAYVNQLCTILSQAVWEYLYDTFGGGPACNRLYACVTCQQEQEALQRRIRHELDVFLQLSKEFQGEDNPAVICVIAMSWFRQWQSFVRGKETEPPGAIDNTSVISVKNGLPVLKTGSDYGQFSEETWRFFHSIYGGGPELVLRPPSSRGQVGRPLAPAPPRDALKARSTENITCGDVRPMRTQSASSDNINLRVAAQLASGRGQEGREGQEDASQHSTLVPSGEAGFLLARLVRAGAGSVDSGTCLEEVQVRSAGSVDAHATNIQVDARASLS